MHGSYSRAFVLTMVAACGSGTSGPKTAPVEPPKPIVAQVTVDAAPPPPDAAPAPRLACPEDATVTLAPAPEPTVHCTRADGTRHGPFVTLFPDETIEISGAYRDGVLDGAWTRRDVNSTVVEEGTYVAGLKDGRWRQISSRGVGVGEYEMNNGTGIERAWYEDGALYRERELKAGVQHGPDRIFEPDGSNVVSAHYDTGKLDGPHVFGTRQTMRFEETFKDGVRRGKRLVWVQGTLIAEETYDRAGRFDGSYTLWRRAKVMRAKGQFDHGKRVGAWTWFDRSNDKEREGSYVSGKRDGTWQEWSEARLVFSGTYANGKPVGDFVHFDRAGRELGRFAIQNGTGTMLTFHTNRRPSSRQYLYRGTPAGIYQELTPLGKVVVEGRYRNDLKHGTWQEWTPDGVPRLEQTWKHGVLDGNVRKYVDGKIASESTYADGKVTGPYTEYRAGKPAVTGQYVDDKKEGTWTTYAADGSVILTATYKAGVLDGPWRQLVDDAVVDGVMVAGRRHGTWTRTDRAGVVSRLTYAAP